MKTMFDDNLRNDILRRIERVTPESRPSWGKMNAEQMLAHLVASSKMAIGELKTQSKKLPIRYPPLRQLIVYWLPWPKSSPTAPELMISDPGSVERSKEELTRLLTAFGARANETQWPEHPAFGNLSRRGWGVLSWRHFDHHLRQFGV
ncbi:MAG TPA: DUF1569 domain-containing protein [Thermoanaerobaculia bacterium]|nr:DUF1569 domain-containing protein [Thermoanaerobaculia bacterium]